MPRKNSLQISTRVVSTKLTPEQERFNFLIVQVEKARTALVEWEAAVAVFRQTRLQKLQPLHDSLNSACRESVFAVDRLLDQSGWSRAERAELREILCGTADVLLEVNGADEEIKALYDKHSDVDFDTSKQDELQRLKAEAEEFTGLDLGDDEGILSEEDLVERVYREMAAREAAQAERKEAKAQRRRESAAKRSGEDSAQLARQSLREIYRRLASAVHPDREADPVRREEKNVLMQRINQAYAANDLLTLFEAQMQIEQIDAGAIAKVSQQRLRQYNRLLAEQLTQSKEKLRESKAAFVMDHGLEQHSEAHPQKMRLVIQKQARRLRAEIARQQQFLRVLASKASTRRWLKQQRRFGYAEDDDL